MVEMCGWAGLGGGGVEVMWERFGADVCYGIMPPK